jgi:hypothetical protein
LRLQYGVSPQMAAVASRVPDAAVLVEVVTDADGAMLFA